MRQRERVAAVSTLLLLTMAGCHGRPLQAQIAHARPSPAGTTESATGTVGSAPAARRLDDLVAQESEHISGERHVAQEDVAKAIEAVRSRDPRRSRPRRPVSSVRARMNGDLANAAQPSFMDPAKAYTPGEFGVDVLAFAAFMKCIDLFRGRKR